MIHYHELNHELYENLFPLKTSRTDALHPKAHLQEYILTPR